MLPLMEMLEQGGNGSTLREIGRQYGLSVAQTENAMEALLPAFSEALKRNVGDPYGFAAFLDALSSGRHAAYHEEPSAAFSDMGVAEGNAILGHLFGSKDVSRAVAAQAAQMSGLSQDLLKSLLPSLAPIILGGLFKQLSGGWTGGGATNKRGQQDNPLGRIFEEMMGGGGRSAGGGNPWGKMLEQMMGGGMSSGGRQADNPLGDIIEQMMRGGRPAEPKSRERDEPLQQDRPAGKGGFDELFGEMFDTGRKVQKDYNRQMESIFDEFMAGMKR